MSRPRLSSLCQHRGLLAAPAPVYFLIGVLFAGQLPGEPLHHRLWLVALLCLAFVAGALLRCDGTDGAS